MFDFNDEYDITIAHTIQNCINLLCKIDQGVKGYTEEDKHEVEKELAELEAEMKRRYPDAD